MPQYINYGGDSTLPPPYAFGKTTLYGFFLKANPHHLQAMLDQRLNFPATSNYCYDVFSSQVMVTFAAVKHGASIPQINNGYDTEAEMLVWVLALEKVRVGNKWVANRLVWMVPYIIVDNFWAIASAREVYGFPKTLGQTTLPESSRKAEYFGSTVWGFQTYSPQTLMTEQLAISMSKDKGFKDELSELESVKDFAKAMKGQIMKHKLVEEKLGLLFCWNEMNDLLNLNFHWVFLKQFRGIEDSTSACYQAITECTFHLEPKTFRGAGLYLHPFVLNLPDIASYPLGKELGLETGQKSELGFWIDIDFQCNTGKVLWQAS